MFRQGKVRTHMIAKGNGQPRKLFKRFSFLGRLLPADYAFILMVSPILVVVLLDPSSFALGWNQGRGGIAFALALLAFEWIDARSTLTIKRTLSHLVTFGAAVVWISVFYAAVFAVNLHGYFSDLAAILRVEQGIINWPWMWEYVALATYFAFSALAIFGWSGIRAVPTPVVYSLGMAAILSLDSFFPYGSLGFLQGWVYVIWNLVLVLLRMSGVTVSTNPFLATSRPWAFLWGNRLLIIGKTGSLTLTIYWPSSGIVSMLIYSVVLLTLLLKLHSPWKRKVTYAILGAIGTFFVNVFRIFLISYYVAFISIDVNAFHEVIGEVLFIIWVIIFLSSVLYMESRTNRSRSLKILSIPASQARYRPIATGGAVSH